MFSLILAIVTIGLLYLIWRYADDSIAFSVLLPIASGVWLLTRLGVGFGVSLLLCVVVSFALMIWGTKRNEEKSSTNRNTNTKENEKQPPKVAVQEAPRGSISINPRIYRDDVSRRYYTSAYCSDGVIYSTVGHQTVKIGYYKRRSDSANECWEVFEEDHALIGKVVLQEDGNVWIFISLEGIYERFKKRLEESMDTNRWEMRTPPEMERTVAYIKKGATSLLDFETQEQIATYSGAAIGAAAAFIGIIGCFTPESKYTDFRSSYGRDGAYKLRS